MRMCVEAGLRYARGHREQIETQGTSWLCCLTTLRQHVPIVNERTWNQRSAKAEGNKERTNSENRIGESTSAKWSIAGKTAPNGRRNTYSGWTGHTANGLANDNGNP